MTIFGLPDWGQNKSNCRGAKQKAAMVFSVLKQTVEMGGGGRIGRGWREEVIGSCNADNVIAISRGEDQKNVVYQEAIVNSNGVLQDKYAHVPHFLTSFSTSALLRIPATLNN